MNVSFVPCMPDSSQADAKFLPPQQNPLLTRLIQSICYPVAYLLYKIRLEVDEEDVAKLKEIADRRVVYLPNHSNLDDGIVMFLLSARIGQLFNYVVAHEAFQGWIGKLMQTVGAYSIRRGVGDRYSIVQTLKILQQPQCKLVIFPEGGCSYQNETVIPFRSGAVELSFKAIAKLVKNNHTIPDFYLVPVSLNYYYPDATDAQIDRALRRLEQALSLKLEGDLYSRLKNIGQRVLEDLETEYGVTSSDRDLNKRIDSLRTRMLNYCENKLEIDPAIKLPDRERIYKIQSILSLLSDAEKQPDIDYEHIYLTTVRLLNFDALYNGYVAEKPTPGRFFATIDRLEREVFQIDRPKFKGQRRVMVKIGTPINLKEYWLDYHQNNSAYDKSSRQRIIDDLTAKAQQTVQANLN